LTVKKKLSLLNVTFLFKCCFIGRLLVVVYDKHFVSFIF